MLTLNNLAEFPFLRFDTIRLDYNAGSHQIANKCEIFASQLQKLSRLHEANSISVWASVRQKGHGYFIDHTQFLEHLRNQLLPIFGYCRRFEFRIGLRSDKANIITSILEMQQIIGCPNVAFRLPIYNHNNQHEHLPIETISNWLHRNGNTVNGGNEVANQSQQERVLEIEVENISDVVELWNHFKKVLLFGIFGTF